LADISNKGAGLIPDTYPIGLVVNLQAAKSLNQPLQQAQGHGGRESGGKILKAAQISAQLCTFAAIFNETLVLNQ
jgi:hypothetical protein